MAFAFPGFDFNPDLSGPSISTAPQELIENWDDSLPIVLFPVRIETRFMQGRHVYKAPKPKEKLPSYKDEYELWVRIFPDDIAVSSHESLLTESEWEVGLAYWQERYAAGTSEDAHKAAWRRLAGPLGNGRAAWVKSETQPTEFTDVTQSFSAEPTFPSAEDQTFKSSTWTEAAKSYVMPERFVVLAYRGNELYTETGNKIPNPLVVGMAPGTEEEFDTENGDLIPTEDLKWLTDFFEAEKVGMGIRVPLSGLVLATGLSEVFVIGLKTSADETETQELLEKLFNDHHFSDNLSLLKQGTPTNNTEISSSGYSAYGEDADIGFEMEAGAALFTPTDTDTEKADGQWLADALGLDYSVFEHLSNANSTQISDALKLNKTLYPATLGYFLEQFMGEVVSENDQKYTQEFFEDYLSGRGLIPAIRVGRQPYGFLPTSALSKWTYPSGMLYIPRNEYYRKLMSRILAPLDALWDDLSEEVLHLGDSRMDSLEDDFMKMISLQASSLSFNQRVMLGPALLWNLKNFISEYRSDTRIYENNSYNSEEKIKAAFESLGFNSESSPSLFGMTGMREVRKLDGPIVQKGTTSDTTPLHPLGESPLNYLQWLGAATHGEIFDETLPEGESAPKALLYLLARHAYLVEYANVSFQLLQENGSVEPIDKKISELPGLLTLNQPSNQPLWYQLSLPFGPLTGNLSMRAHISKLLQEDDPRVRSLKVLKQNLTELGHLSTGELERLFSEHVDICSYRLDAWTQGLINQRLFQGRGRIASRKKGAYLGAYAWVENLKPEGDFGTFAIGVKRKSGKSIYSTLPTNFSTETDPTYAPSDPLTYLGTDTDFVPEVDATTGKVHGPLLEKENSEGFIHTFSLTHAVTSAILRSGYLAHSDPDDPETQLAVNLESLRVKKAMWYLGGIRQGQSLGALLGYRFERMIYEGESVLISYLEEMRATFPLAVNSFSPGDDVGAMQSRHVVDGLKMLESSRSNDWESDLSKTWLGDITSDSGDQSDLKAVVEALKDDMDAISDLALAESVFQAARGNQKRARAWMNFMSEATDVPEPEIINLPRTGKQFTQKFALVLDPDKENYRYWKRIWTQRSTLEPALNEWLGDIFGSDKEIGVRYEYENTDDEGVVQSGRAFYKLDYLQLQPLDFVMMVGRPGDELDATPIADRFRFFIQNSTFKKPMDRITILWEDRAGQADNVRTVGELVPLAQHLGEMIRNARALQADDLERQSDSNREANWDVADLKARVTIAVNGASSPTRFGIKTCFRRLQVYRDRARDMDFETETASKISSNLYYCRLEMLRLSQFQVSKMYPNSIGLLTPEARDSLVEQIGPLVEEGKVLWKKATAALAEANTLTGKEAVKAYFDILDMLYGKDLVFLPRFSLNNTSELIAAHAHATATSGLTRNSGPYPAKTWLQGLSRVRPALGRYAYSELMAAISPYTQELPSLLPVQLPVTTNESGDTIDQWLGAAYDEAYEIPSDPLSLVLQLPEGYAPSNDHSGLLLDEWNEILPEQAEATAVALNYNNPDNRAAQAILLAISPEVTGEWKWEDLVDTLKETLAAAKKRAVDPELLQDTAIAQALPALISVLSADDDTPQLDFARNLSKQISGIFNGAIKLDTRDPDQYLFKK